ncbi:unnamed protein product [Symbiodinium sp. CCMP2592]|nr:unnamed protein product [Symbiodinium sp. CCMP2592]
MARGADGAEAVKRGRSSPGDGVASAASGVAGKAALARDDLERWRLHPVATEVSKVVARLRQQGKFETLEQLAWNVMERVDEAWFTGSVVQELFYPKGGFRPSRNLGNKAEVQILVEVIWQDTLTFLRARGEEQE